VAKIIAFVLGGIFHWFSIDELLFLDEGLGLRYPWPAGW